MIDAAARLKELLTGGEPCLGTWVLLPYPMNVEILARKGGDFLLFDGEHSAIDYTRLPAMLLAAEAASRPVAYRVRSSYSDDIKSALDAGVSALMVPSVETAEEAERIVQAVRYPPLGRRGIGPWRASRFYEEMDSYLQTANDRMAVIVQIETVKGLENARAIAAVDGVDVLYVGPADLSAALGLSLGRLSEELMSACWQVAEAATRAGKALGIDLLSPDDLPRLVKAGFSVFTYGSDAGFLQAGAAASRQEFERGFTG